MWDHAEVFALIDAEGVVRAVSRNEDEAAIEHVIGCKVIEERVIPTCQQTAQAAFDAALRGEEMHAEIGALADDGEVFWSRVKLARSPVAEIPVLLHSRRLPRSWSLLSPREKEIIRALHAADLNPKRAAKQLGIALNTFNAHRRTITQKCGLAGVGDFWIFVERCR